MRSGFGRGVSLIFYIILVFKFSWEHGPFDSYGSNFSKSLLVDYVNTLKTILYHAG